MRIEILKEDGYIEALTGLSLSYNQRIDKMPEVALKLCDKDGGHNKFLESIVVWLDIKAPRYWWQQFSTYRAGVSTQSESTIHTLMKQELIQEDFEFPISEELLEVLNECIKNKDFKELKNILPEGFLQRRIVCTNYKTLRNIISQRKTHKLDEWNKFCYYLLSNLKYKELMKGL